MQKELTIRIANVSGEDGLSVACREGKLFRNDPGLENLYKEGFRIYNYSVEGEDNDPRGGHYTNVKVFLEK